MAASDSFTQSRDFWLNDSTLLVLRCKSLAFKIHRSLLARQSSTPEEFPHDKYTVDDPSISAEDLTRLFEHLYHDVPLHHPENASFERVASILRASHVLRLDRIHGLAIKHLESIYPVNPRPGEYSSWRNTTDALELATKYNAPSVVKGLLYAIVTTSELDVDDTVTVGPQESSDGTAAAAALVSEKLPSKLSKQDVERCSKLLTRIVDYFTPILFAVGSAGHMNCTDALAEVWMPAVIQPSLDNAGVSSPLETLQAMISIDWTSHGLCAQCTEAKRQEWREEQQTLWECMDQWVQ